MITQFTEAVMAGTGCFLEQESWKATLRSAIQETTTFSDCSEIVVSLWTRITELPRLFAEIEEVVYNAETAPASRITHLTTRIIQFRQNLLEWRESYRVLTANTRAKSASGKMTAHFDRRFETLGVYIANMIILNRLMASLNRRAGPLIEDETQQLARELMDLGARAREMNPRAFLFVAFKQAIASAALQTESSWRSGYELREDSWPSSCIPWPLYEQWCVAGGRKPSVLVMSKGDDPFLSSENY